MKATATGFRNFLVCTAAVVAGLLATPIHATTFVALDQEQLADISDAAVLGTVVAIQSGRSADTGAIQTDIDVAVEEVLFGEIDEAVVVIREAGGRVDGEEEWNYGAPSFHRGERIMVFLSATGDGTFRTTAMALGKFRVETDEYGAAELVRELGEGVQLLDSTGTLTVDPDAEVMPMSDTLRDRRRESRNGRRDRESLVPVALEAVEDMEEYTFLGSSPARWFESDSGEPVLFRVDPTGDPGPLLGPAQSVAAIYDAFDAWSGVSGSSFRITEEAPLPEPLPFAGCTGGNRIVFNDPFNEISDPSGCGGVLAVGGFCTSAETGVVNGTSFRRIRVGKVTFNNGWSSCFDWNRCNLSEVATHEIGHAIGLGHSPETNAIMRASAYFNGRCSKLGSDDEDAMRFMYPALAVSATNTPTRTPTRTFTSSPTRTSTKTPTNVPSNPTATPTPTLTFTQTPTPTPTTNSNTPSTGGSNHRLGGLVYYHMNGGPVPGVEVRMNGSESRSMMTGADGGFDFEDVPHGAGVALDGAKQGDVGNAISSLDAAYVLQAVVGYRQLSPLQRLSCDVTGDGSISPLDATRVLQYALGGIKTFPVATRCGSPWLLVPSSSQTDMAVAPEITPGDCTTGGYQMSEMADDMTDLMFEAVLFGDCNGGWRASAQAQLASENDVRRSRVRVGRPKVKGTSAIVPVYVRASQPYMSLDLDLRYDAAMLSPAGAEGRRVSDSAIVAHRVVEPGLVRLAFASPDLVTRRQGVLLFVKFDVIGSKSSAGIVRPVEARVDEANVTMLPNRSRR